MDKTYYTTVKNEIPKTSGVYIFQDAQRRPLYIGKATSLASRVRSYFLEARSPMIARMLEQAERIAWQETLSDIEAMILESTLIKKHKPAFNIMLRDDKQYFYVGISKTFYPRIIVTHQPTNPKISANFIGPFTDGKALKITLKALRKVFPFCTCKQPHHRACLNYHIGQCLGFCCVKNAEPTAEQKTEYKKNISAIKHILEGKRSNVIKKLIIDLKRKEITNAVEAQKIRAQILKLQRVFENTQLIKHDNERRGALSELKKLLGLPSIPTRIEGYDISNIQGLFATGSMVVFTHGTPDKNEYRKFKIKTVFSSDDTAMLREVLERRLKHSEWQMPDLILIDGGKGQVNSAKGVILEAGFDIPVIGLIKNSRHIGEKILLENKNVIPLDDVSDTLKNLLLNIDSEAHRFAIAFYRSKHRDIYKYKNR